MKSIFPLDVQNLPQVIAPHPGVTGFLVQGENQQVVFMQFDSDVNVPEHSHDSQWEIVLEGRVDYLQDGKKHTYTKGDRFFVPKGKNHAAHVYAGYCCIMFFNQKDRYKKKE